MTSTTSQNFDPEEYFKFDDISTYVEVFTQNSTPDNRGDNLEIFDQQINQLEELFQIYTQKVQDMSVPKSYFNSATSIYISNKIFYCSCYLFSKEIKLFRFKEYLYSKTISIIASIISEMKKKKEEKSEITYCQIDELEIFLNNKINNNSYVLKAQDKIDRLISFIHPYGNAEIPVFQLKVALEESIKNLNDLCDCSSYGSFDDFLYYYIYLSNPKKIKKNRYPFLTDSEKNFDLPEGKQDEDEKQNDNNNIDEMIDELVDISVYNLENSHLISFHSDNQNVSFKVIEEKIFDLLNIEKPEEQVILKTSLVRIIFDRLYQHQEFFDLLSSKKNQENVITFQNKCAKMFSKTPQEMQISPNLLKSDLLNKPFKIIIESDKLYLKKAIDYLSFIPFFTNPIDILAHIYFVLKECESFLVSQKSDIEDTENNRAENIISFDDIFPIFCSVLGYGCPSNCLGIKRFLEIIQGFIFNSQLNYANSIFLSAISYISTDL